MKKFVSLILGVAIMLSIGVPAFAFDTDTTTDNLDIVSCSVSNEYEMWLIEQNESEVSTYSNNQEEIPNYYEALYERAQLPEETLSSMGYSDEQISQLKDYAADPAHSNIDFYATSSDVVGKFTCRKIENGKYSVVYTWEWSIMPLYTKTDAVAVRWKGVDTGGNYIDLYCDKGSYTATANYYGEIDGLLHTSKTLSAEPGDDTYIRQAEIPMTTYADGETVWAKSGKFTCTLTVGGTKALNYFYMCGGYAHLTFKINAKITVKPTPESVTFTFLVSGEEVKNSYFKKVRITSNCVISDL